MKTITIEKNEKPQEYLKKLKNLKLKGLDAKKYLGKLDISENPLDIQKRLRDEWK